MNDNTEVDTEYVTELHANRNEKDEFFRSHPQSPLSDDAREAFDGLSYFDPDPSWRVTATVETLAVDPDDADDHDGETGTTADSDAGGQQQDSSQQMIYEPVPMEPLPVRQSGMFALPDSNLSEQTQHNNSSAIDSVRMIKMRRYSFHFATRQPDRKHTPVGDILNYIQIRH